MTGAHAPVATVTVTPVVSWPRQALPGERYLITVDLRLDEPDTWPYDNEEEYTVALMLTGGDHVRVTTLGDTSVVLHRFGGTYGAARFVAAVDNDAPAGASTGLWLTLISSGGVPFHTARLQITVTHDAPRQPAAATLPVGPVPRRLPTLAGSGADVWSMIAFEHGGQPILAIGTDHGTLRVWRPDIAIVDNYEIAPGRVHVTLLPGPDGRPRVLAASGHTLTLLDPAAGTPPTHHARLTDEPVTALASVPGPNGDPTVAIGYADGSIHLLQDRNLQSIARFRGHTGPVYSMTSLDLDGQSVLVSVGLDSSARVWNLNSGQLVMTLNGHTAQINCVTALTGEPPAIATASDDGTVRVWSLPTGTVTEIWQQANDWINTVVELPAGGRRPVLLWGGRGGTLGWARGGGRRSTTSSGDTRAVTVLTSLQWADRRIVAVARAGGDIELRNANGFRIDEHRSAPTVLSPADFDAIIVVPSTMGSELVDTATGEKLWGLSGVRWYMNAWTSGSTLRTLQVTGDERDGRTERIRATKLLQTPALLPGLAGIEPYAQLVRAVRQTRRHPDAVLEFPYDWRLSTLVNARLLAEAAAQHLDAWRRHPSGSADARLLLVAHGAGGLVARAYVGLYDYDSDVRLTIGMGVPYAGSIRALELISDGRGAPLPLGARRMRELAVTLPGLYDLLPSYRCVQDDNGMRHLTPRDVADLGGDPDLAEAAFGRIHKIQNTNAGRVLSVVGLGQPTPQSLRLEDNILIPQRFLPSATASGELVNVDNSGDGTVPRISAIPAGNEQPPPLYCNQTAGGMCRDTGVLNAITGWLTQRPLGPPL